ncbi:hypothetical protein LCGC14_1048820 [marine sediment metagenome]|uniref:Uncharacterized protein n=1 Tax=marine sediment metagenome TaxID=412755 RepID=A0A0F9MTV8_9ZZZZ|nr:hypothetical protein [Candidatus Aminicenantes bacterium]
MKRFIGLICFLILLFAQTVFADDEFTIWTNQTFLPANGVSFVDQELIATSNEIMNLSDYSSLNIIIKYETLVPDESTGAATYTVQAVIENSIVGNWIPILTQSQGIKNTKSFPVRILTMIPEFNMVRQPGNNYGIQAGLKKLARVTIAAGHLTSKFRVKLFHKDDQGGFPLTSITVSAFGRMFGREFVPAGTP